MGKKEAFIEEITSGYTFKGSDLVLGGAMLGEEVFTNTLVKAPLSTFNRHGLIAGATGTGKTKTLQVLAEHLSKNGVPVMLMDVKGDLSGLAKPSPGHPKIDERHEKIGIPFEAEAMPVELMSISDDVGCRMRATVSEFGPVLLAKMLGGTETQSSIISVLFKYCDDKKLPLADLKDLKKLIQYALKEGKEEMEGEYGRMHPSSLTSILRKIVELEEQGGDKFFGEPSFDIDDLQRTDDKGRGYISILRVTDIQDKPKLFSTFMLALLAEIYGTFPEAGDRDKPKLVLFIDEAHLIFKEASEELLGQIESVVKLIRSKSVGVFFITQNPADVPESVLGQLGMKVQHALRAFTAKDRKAIKLAAENYPISNYYDTAEELTQLGIGESLVSVLDEKGRPTPLVRCMMRAPVTRMDVLESKEMDELVKQSDIYDDYAETIDKKTAHEILTAKLEKAADKTEKAKASSKKSSSSSRSRSKKKKTVVEEVVNSTTGRQILRTATREIIRGVLGSIGVKSTRSSGWF
ncbi:MAG: DUF853 domain-containing protein [Saprospiraceae bacterium]|nr:DUF853 domain-containing protein [Saprospiraceae bacterium]